MSARIVGYIAAVRQVRPAMVACWLRLHRWRYFVDGHVCRACARCRRIEYDLPSVGQ